MKKLLPLLLLVFLLVACGPVEGAAQTVVELPNQLQVLIGLGVAWLVRKVLGGTSVPEEFQTEIAVAITTALVTVVGVLLKLIPLGLEAIATTVLNLVVLLLGGAWVAGLLRTGAVRVGLLPR